MKHDDSIQGVLIQSVLRHCGGRVRFRLCRTVVALIPIIPIILGASSCRKETPPQPYVRSIELEALDASCTEAWLRVRFTDSASPRAFALQRDGQTILTALSSPPDTLLIDEGLLPNRTYTYKAYRLEGQTPNPSDSTQPVQLTTMDTTSHNFTWQIDTLGDGSSSVLYDVAIINDTLAYAVGEIYKRDSLGNWINPPFNIAKWNGRTWELSRRMYDCRLYYPNCGPGYFLYAPARSIFAFGPDDIWVAVGTAQHWDGVRWTEHAGIEGVGGAYKIWGTSSRDLYFVGYGGFIAHYDGVRWRRIESGTDVDIKDIWGSYNSRTNTREIACVASFGAAVPQGRKLIEIINGAAAVLPDTGLPLNLDGIWFKAAYHYYLTGSGLYQKRTTLRSSTPWQAIYPGVPSYHTNSVRGNDINDVFHAGHFGELLHFNGSTYASFRGQTGLANGVYKSLWVRGNLLIAVGYEGDRAVILRGRRTN